MQENRPSEAASGDEDFLYHLYRGSEMLMEDRVVEAKEELEKALQLQPQDAKSQDLLAGVYFRLGFFPRAIEIWERLVQAYPKNATLHINLGLALFKTERADAALDHFHAALRIQPDHERAWGYLGLLYWRLGRIQDAREAFVKGGQATMARRMEEVLGSSAGELGAPADGTASGAMDHSGEHEAAMRSAAEEAIEQFEEERLSIASQEQAATGRWSAVEPGEERVPRAPAPERRAPRSAPARLSSLLSTWTVPTSEEAVFVVGPEGELYVHTSRDVYLRLGGIQAVLGQLATSHVARRTRGKDLEESLGGDNPVFRWQGPLAAILTPPEGQRFMALTLQEQDVLYVKERHLWGFDDRVGFESGKLPLGGGPVVLTQLYGTGSVVLSLSRAPKALRVEEGQEVRVEPDALLGWTGRLFPDVPRGTRPYGIGAPALAFRGDGVVLVG